MAFSWVHTFNPDVLMTVLPFYHFNEASYNGSPNDYPTITNVTQTANYAGAQATLAVIIAKTNDVQVGGYGFAQRQSNFFNNVITDCAPDCANFGPSSAAVTGGLVEGFVNDRFKVTPWLTLIAGVRYSHFDSGPLSGGTQPAVVESVTDPRLGVAVRVPKRNWGVSRILGRVLSGAAVADGDRSADRFGQQPEPDVWRAARRT
jgi:outer membrane receptor protein involved in Fe transport